ncbi:MAG: ImmA/IrrE family metallo-endopeptidase [Cetobacterium sp.]
MIQNYASTIQINSTKAEPRSRQKIEAEVEQFRKNCKITSSKGRAIDVLKVLDLSTEVYGYEYQVVEDRELPYNVYAETDLIHKKIYIKESVYDRAAEGSTRDRFTIAHEIGHVIMHTDKIIVCRGDEIKKYEYPEWQADHFAAELLVPVFHIGDLSVDEIKNKYKVSKKVAQIRKDRANSLKNPA